MCCFILFEFNSLILPCSFDLTQISLNCHQMTKCVHVIKYIYTNSLCLKKLSTLILYFVNIDLRKVHFFMQSRCHVNQFNLTHLLNCLRIQMNIDRFLCIQVNTTLTSIDLSWNGLLYNGSVAVSKCLKSSKTLTSLDISHNNINWNGAYVMSKGLAANDTLQVLKVKINL